MAPATDRAVALVDAAHDALSTFAQGSYERHGRGVTLLCVPNPAPGLVTTDMVYYATADLRERLALLDDADEGVVVLRMVETYDPAAQAVVMVQIGQDHPVSMKMRLAASFVTSPGTGGQHGA